MKLYIKLKKLLFSSLWEMMIMPSFHNKCQSYGIVRSWVNTISKIHYIDLYFSQVLADMIKKAAFMI
ncbi:hypothetical protein CLU79DRAFT_752348 [Phycomyces nitens]|nr:hypothetical protein CLU79DRAFT_752348 [Phycomyces nitens]